MSTPADYLFNQFNDPLAGATTAPPADPLAQEAPGVDPVATMSSHVAANYGPSAAGQDFSGVSNDFATMQRFRMTRRGLKDDDLAGQATLQATYGKDARTLNLAAAADQLETGATQQLYAHFLGQGLDHKEALLRAEYTARAQTDQLLNDPNFSSAFANQYGVNNPAKQPSAEELLASQGGPAVPGESRGVLGSIADVGAQASSVLTQGVLGATGAVVGADSGAVREGLQKGVKGVSEKLDAIADRSFTENVGGFFKNLYHGVSAEVQYGIPQAYYGGAFLIEDYFGNDEEGVTSEAQQYLDKYTQAEADKQSYFSDNDIDPESLGAGIGGVIPAFVGGAGFGTLAKTALTKGIGVQVGMRAQSLISASPMSAYVGGTNYAQVREEGVTKNQALGYASLTGAAAILAESLPFGSMLKRFNIAPGTKGVLAKLAAGEKVGLAQTKAAIGAFLKQGTTELTEETLEEIIDVFGQVGILDRDATEVIRDSVAPYMGQTVPVSFLFGAFLGAGTSPLAVRRARNMAKYKAQADKVVALGENATDAEVAELLGADALGSTTEDTEGDRIDLSVGAEAEATATAASQRQQDLSDTRGNLETELGDLQNQADDIAENTTLTEEQRTAELQATQARMADVEEQLNFVVEESAQGSVVPEGGRETAGAEGRQVQTQPGEGVEEGAGDVGIYAEEVGRMKALQNELELDDAALEAQLEGRADILAALNPAEKEHFKIAGAVNSAMVPELRKYAEGLEATDPEGAALLIERIGEIEANGDVAIAGMLAEGNTEITELVKTVTRAPDTQESAEAIVRIAEIMDGAMGITAEGADIIAGNPAVASASLAYTKLQNKIRMIQNGELTGPTASVAGVVSRVATKAGEVLTGGYDKTRVSANRFIGRLGNSFPDNTPLTEDVVQQMQQALDAFATNRPGDQAGINLLKGNLDFLTAAQKDGRTTVGDFFGRVKTNLGSGPTTAIDSPEQRLAFSQAEADRMAASLNISGVASFSDLQQVAIAKDSRPADKDIAKRVVDAILARDISDVVTNKATPSESVASIDINEVVLDLISTGRVNSFEQAVGQIQRGTMNGKNSDDIFLQMVLKESEKQAKRRLRSEAVGADTERVSVHDEIQAAIFQKSGVQNNLVTSNYARTLIERFLSSAPMKQFGIATESELNKALLSKDGTAIRSRLNSYLEGKVLGSRVVSRNVRDILRDIASGMGVEQADAVSLEITEMDKIVTDLSKKIGQPVEIDFVTNMLIQYGETTQEDVPTFTTRFLRGLKNITRRKTVGDIRDDSDPRMYYGWALAQLPGSTPRRGYAKMAADAIQNGSDYLGIHARDMAIALGSGKNRRTKTRRDFSSDQFVSYMQQAFDTHRQKHAPDATIDAVFLSKIFSDIVYGPETGITASDGTVFNPIEHAEKLNAQVRKLGRTQEPKENEVEYWKKVPLGFLTAEELFGSDISVSAAHQHAIKHLLALNGSPVAADMPVLYLTEDVNRGDARDQISILIKAAMLRDRADHLRKTAHEYPIARQIKIKEQAASLMKTANYNEKESLRRLEKYVGSPSSRKAHNLFELFAGEGNNVIPGEALLAETYRSTAQPEPGQVDYRNGSAQQTLRVLAQRLNVLPTSHAAYSNLRREPDLVRGIFDKMFNELTEDPGSLLTMDPEFLGMVEQVYGIEITTNGDEVFVNKVTKVENINDAIGRMKRRVGYLSDNINLLRGLRNDGKAKISIQKALGNTFSRNALITPAIKQFITEGTTNPGMRQATIDSILRYAMGLAAKEQDIRLQDVLKDDAQRSTVHSNLQLLMSGTGTEDQKLAARSYLTSVLSNGGSLGSLVQTANSIGEIPQMRRLSASIITELRRDFGRAKQTDLPEHETSAAAANSSAAWADISGMALGINSLVPDNTETLDAEAISQIFSIPLTQASAVLRGNTEKTISYLVSITRENKNQDSFAADLARGDEGAQGVLNMLAIGKISAQTGVNLTPGTIDMMGDVIDGLKDFKGAANLLALFKTGHSQQIDMASRISTVVKQNMRGLMAAVEAAEANLFTMPDMDSEASLALRSTSDMLPMLTLDINNLRSFVSSPDAVFTQIPEDSAKQSAIYTAERVAEGQELLHYLDVVLGASRTNPQLIDRESATRSFVAAAEFFKSTERTQLYNWMNWAYTPAGRQAIANNPSAMPSEEILNRRPDSLAQAAEFLGSHFGVNAVAVRGISSAYKSIFTGDNEKVDVLGKQMTVADIRTELSSLWEFASDVETAADLGLPSPAGNRGKAARAANRRTDLYQALQDHFVDKRDSVNGQVGALLDLAQDADSSSPAFNEEIANMASLLIANGEIEGAIALLNQMPLNSENAALLAGLKLNAKKLDASDPANMRAIEMHVGQRITDKLQFVYNQIRTDAGKAAAAVGSNLEVTDQLEKAGINEHAMDFPSALRTIKNIVARNGYYLTGAGGGREVLPGTQGKVSLAARSKDSWGVSDAENAWLALFEAHVRNGYVTGNMMERAGDYIGLGRTDILGVLMSGITSAENADVDINRVALKFSPDNAVRVRALLKAANNVSRNMADTEFFFRDAQLITAALNSSDSVRLQDQVSPAGRKSPTTNGLGIMLDAMEWAFESDPKFAGVPVDLKLEFGDGVVNLGVVTDSAGNRTRPGLKKFMEAIKFTKPATKGGKATAEARQVGDSAKRLEFDLYTTIIQATYANHQVAGKGNINQTLAEIMTNYTSFLMETTSTATLGDAESISRTREDSRRMDAVGALLDQMAANIRQAGLPEQTGLGATVAVTLEKTASAIPSLRTYKAEWQREISRNGGRGRITRGPDGETRLLQLSGAWTLENLYGVLDNVSAGTGNFRADSVEILADFMPPPEVVMGAYTFAAEEEYAAGMDLESPVIQRRIESLLKVGEKGADPLDAIQNYIRNSGPGMERVFRAKILDKEFDALNGESETIASIKGQKAYVMTATGKLQEVGFTPRPTGRGSRPAGSTPTIVAAAPEPGTVMGTNLPQGPSSNVATSITNEAAASQSSISESLERASGEVSAGEVTNAWIDTLDNSGGANAVANRLSAYNAETSSDRVNGVNQKTVGEVRALAENLISNTLANAEITSTSPNQIMGGLNIILGREPNQPTINGINFTAQFLKPAGLQDEYRYMMESDSIITLIETLRGGTDEEVTTASADFTADFPGMAERILQGIGQARDRRGGSPGDFTAGASRAPTQSPTSRASLASVSAPIRVSEDLIRARVRIEEELDRGQVGIFQNLEKKGIVTVVLDTLDVPSEVLAGLSPGERSSTRLQAVTYKNKVWLVAKNMPRGAAWPVLLHEVGVHIGFEQMLGKDGLADLANNIIDNANRGDWVSQRAVSRWRAAAAVNPLLNDRRNPATNHEIVAYFVETQAGTPMSESTLEKILAAIKRWAFEFFGGSAKVLTNKEIMQLAYSAMRRVASATVPPIVTGRADNFTPVTRPAAAAVRMPASPVTGRLDTGDGVVLDVSSPSGEKQQRGKKYYVKRDEAVDKGKDVNDANQEAATTKKTPFEVRKEISERFTETSSAKMTGFVQKYVDAMSPARRAMDKAARAVGAGGIAAEADFIQQAILGVDKHAITENFLGNEILPQIRAITDQLKVSLSGVQRQDGRKWSNDNILQLINHRIEALAAKEQNEAYAMFQAPFNPAQQIERGKVLEQWMSGHLDNNATRRRVVEIFKRHRNEVKDYPAWVREHGHAGSGIPNDTINKILNAEGGAFAAGAQQFAQLNDVIARVQQNTMAILTEAGHVDSKLLPLYGVKYYVPLHGSPQTDKAGVSKVANLITGTDAMVTPNAWGNKESAIVSSKPEEGMRGDAMDRMFLWMMNASQTKAENDVAKAMKVYADTYGPDSPANKVLRVKNVGSADYLEVRNGVLEKTNLGTSISRLVKENEFVLRENGKITLLEIGTQTPDGEATARAVKGTWRTSHPGNEILPTAANNVILGGGRLMASLFTRYNPYFWVRAMFRDSQTYGAILVNEFGAGTAAKFTGELATMMASRLGVGSVGSLARDISRIERGVAPTTSMGQDYLTMLRAGAVTTRTRMLSQEGRNLSVSEAFESKAAVGAKSLGVLLSTISQGAEMLPRIAAFRAFKSDGMTEDQAAFHSKRLMDFSQRGEAIQPGSFITTWFLFIRPALTGSARILESFEQMTRDNPARAAAITSMWIGMGAFMAMLSHYLTDDEDEEDWLGQNPERLMFGVRFPGKSFGMRRDVEIPYGYGIGWFFGIGANLYRGQVKGDFSDMTFGLLGEGAARHFTPFEWQGTATKTVMNMAMPDVMAPFAELATNESRWGYKIYKERESVPDYMDAKSHTPEIWLDASSALNTLGESMGFGDAWSISPDAMRAFAGLVPIAGKTLDIISLGKEGDGMSALLEAAGQLTGVAGPRSDYYMSAYNDLKQARDAAAEEITRIQYMGHGASANDLTNLSAALRIKGMVDGSDKILRKLYKGRQDLADAFTQSGLPKDKEAIARIDELIMRQKAAAVNLGIVE